MWRASGRGCTVIPWAPASRQVRAACTTSGKLPPRELRNTAILLTLTLRTVMESAGIARIPAWANERCAGAADSALRVVLRAGRDPARICLLAQAPELVRG